MLNVRLKSFSVVLAEQYIKRVMMPFSVFVKVEPCLSRCKPLSVNLTSLVVMSLSCVHTRYVYNPYSCESVRVSCGHCKSCLAGACS